MSEPEREHSVPPDPKAQIPEESSKVEDASYDSEDSDEGVAFTPIYQTGATNFMEAGEVGSPSRFIVLPYGENITNRRVVQYTHQFIEHTAAHGVRWAIANYPPREAENNPTPFYRDTVERIYELWRAEIVDETLYKGGDHKAMKYTNFTFIVLDDKCMESDPWQLIVACDAPDYGEDDSQTRLKYFYMPLGEAASSLSALEYLTMPPSEVESRKETVLSFFPPATMMPVRDENGDCSEYHRPATREEAITNRRRMLARGPQSS
ncbi:MAG: hypothetical protein Q9174_004224 [Haloplaca sp. 1 TL-2023]